MSAQNIRTIYFAFLALLPCIFIPNYIVDPVLVPRELALCGFVWLILGLMIYSKSAFNWQMLKTTPFVIIGLFLTVMISSGFNSGMNSENLYVISKWLIVLAFFTLTTQLIYNKLLTQSAIISGIVAFAGIAVLMGYWDIFTIIQSQASLMKKITSIKSLFANKNLFSSVLFLCLPFLWMALKAKNKLSKAAGLILLSAIPLIILIQTRATWLAIVVFIAVILAFNLKNGARIVGLLTTFLISGTYLFYQFLAPVIRAQKPEGTIENFFFRLSNFKTISDRTEYWSNAWQMWLEYPWLGVGPGNFGKYFPKYGLVESNVLTINGIETLQRVHNDFLSVLCEIGIVGLLLFVALIGFILLRLIHLISSNKSTGKHHKYVILLAGILGYVVILFLDFPMERIEHQVLFFILIAWIVAEDLQNKQTNTEIVPNHWIKIVLLSVAIYATWVSVFRWKGEFNTVKMYQAKQQQDWSNVVYYGQKAQSRCYQVDPQSIPINWYLGIAYFSRGELDQSFINFKKAYALAPHQIQVIHNLGVVYEQKNELNKAINLYRQALKISPKFEDGLLSLSGCYYKKGQFDQAFKTIDQVDIESRNIRYRKYLVKILIKEMNSILARLGNQDISAQLAKKITTSNDIMHFYWNAKMAHLSFETYIKTYKV